MRRLATQVLTPREHQVISGILSGLGTPELAIDLGVAQGAIRVHIHNATKKLKSAIAKLNNVTLVLREEQS